MYRTPKNFKSGGCASIRKVSCTRYVEINIPLNNLPMLPQIVSGGLKYGAGEPKVLRVEDEVFDNNKGFNPLL